MLDRVFEPLQANQIVRVKLEAASLDSTSCQGASPRNGRSNRNGPQAVGKSHGGWNTKVHRVAADARTALTFSLSPGQTHDTPTGRELIRRLAAQAQPPHLLKGRVYEGNEARQLALDLGFIPVAPPLRTRVDRWEYDRAMYRHRNEVERPFRRIRGFRRIFSRFEKLDVSFLGFISFTFLADALRLC